MANNAPTCHGFSWLWLLLLLGLWCLVLYCPMMSSALVVRELPGFDGPLPFFLETGYVEVDESNGVQLFYYFVQSERDPARDPLLLWLEGGPGCSGLSGLVNEIGKTSGESLHFNLKGYIAGNPMTDKKFDTDGKIHFFHGMGLISDELYELAKVNCRGSYDPPANHQCAKYIESINHCTKDINEFHILEPSCKTLWRNVTEKAEMHRVMLESDGVGHDSYELLYIWTNDESVRKNLGIRQETVGEWRRCNISILYEKDIPSTVEHHRMLRRSGYQALIYSGDHDSAFSFVGTQAWIRSLNLSINDDWRPWHVDDQVAGFTTGFSSNLTYATVKGAGHTAPEYKPKECLTMFSRWISSIPL